MAHSAYLGKGLPYKKVFFEITGSHQGAIFLQQLVYWALVMQKKGRKSFYKTSQELFDETQLSYKQQLRLRRLLEEKGILKCSYDRKKHWVHFEVDLDAIEELIGQRIKPNSTVVRFGEAKQKERLELFQEQTFIDAQKQEREQAFIDLHKFYGGDL